jgi:NAD(P)-dependent dehydrogenase (short-subunit alcohol dehydrogenase family)
MELTNKVAWITGGARMGLAVARDLAQEGCRIALTYRQSRKPAEEAAQELIAGGGEAIALKCDLTKKAQIERASRAIVRHYGRLDILINLSSMYEKGEWAEHMKTNAESAFELTNAVAPWMNRSGGGRIVHIADWTSASGRPRYTEYAPYYVSKAAIKAVVEAMALELAPTITVNAIAPGPMLPPKGLSAREYRSVIAATPLARWGGAEEMAKTVHFLCETDFVTGETIRLDGGRHLF